MAESLAQSVSVGSEMVLFLEVKVTFQSALRSAIWAPEAGAAVPANGVSLKTKMADSLGARWIGIDGRTGTGNQKVPVSASQRWPNL